MRNRQAIAKTNIESRANLMRLNVLLKTFIKTLNSEHYEKNNNKFLVDTQWLSNHLQDDNIVIVDCQWDENAYIKAHIPNAIMRPGHSYLKSEENGELSKYLPGADEFSRLMTEAGDLIEIC